MTKSKPDKMLVRGAKVHNLKNIDVDIPLNKIVGIAGISGSAQDGGDRQRGEDCPKGR